MSENSQDPFANFLHPDHFGKSIGYKVTQFDRQNHEARVNLEIKEKHLSPAGNVHGGVISALLDFTSGAAVCTTLERNDSCSTVELKVNYFYPLNLGDQLEAVANIVFRGGRLCVLQTFLYRNGDKDAVAMATATFNVRREKA